MPSPFPGMDPFIESRVWGGFHLGLMVVIPELLTPQVRPRYVVRVETRVYLEHFPEEPAEYIGPDLTVLESQGVSRPMQIGGGTAVAAAPLMLALPMPERRRDRFLTVRERESMEVVAVIEVLSPGNKRVGSDGRQKYLKKREAVLLSRTHLIELDLLRRGERLPTTQPPPVADYYAFVSREQHRPIAEVYAWSLRQPMPTIRIPLTGDDPDVSLDLQAAFTTVYDRAGYDYSLDYRHPVEPPLSEEDAAWVQERLAAASSHPPAPQA
jgi:hypothetical protein